MKTINLTIFGISIAIYTNSDEIIKLIDAIYLAFKTPPPPSLKFAIEYQIEQYETSKVSYGLSNNHQNQIVVTDEIGYLLYILEKELTITLQEKLPELLFIHAAAAAYNNKAFILIAPSGTGKSTTVWELTNVGCVYLSDELAPLNPNSLTLFGYPRAINLKSLLHQQTMPSGLIETERGYHLPVDTLPTLFLLGSQSLAAIFFLVEQDISTDSSKKNPLVEPVSIGEAAQHLYANSLNTLAHKDKGLEAAIHIASSSPSFRVKAKQDLRETCQEICKTLSALNSIN